MKAFKGKFAKKEEGDRFNRRSQKSFRKTGKNLLHVDPETIFIPNYKGKSLYYW